MWQCYYILSVFIYVISHCNDNDTQETFYFIFSSPVQLCFALTTVCSRWPTVMLLWCSFAQDSEVTPKEVSLRGIYLHVPEHVRPSSGYGRAFYLHTPSPGFPVDSSVPPVHVPFRTVSTVRNGTCTKATLNPLWTSVAPQRVTR